MRGTTLGLMQRGSERIQLLLQLRNSAVGFLLPLATGLRDDALPTSFRASLARYLRMRWVLVTSYFQPTTGLTRAWSLRVFRTSAITPIRAASIGSHLILVCRACLVALAITVPYRLLRRLRLW